MHRILFLAVVISSCTSCALLNRKEKMRAADRFVIIERSLKGKPNGNAYTFSEALLLSYPSTHESGLRVRKTICVNHDCRTSPPHSLGKGRKNRVKSLFDVEEEQLDEKFTITTDLLTERTLIKRYTYQLYPRDCIRAPCMERYRK